MYVLSATVLRYGGFPLTTRTSTGPDSPATYILLPLLSQSTAFCFDIVLDVELDESSHLTDSIASCVPADTGLTAVTYTVNGTLLSMEARGSVF